MILLKGVIENGQVVLPQPANLPDGTEVTVLSHAPCETLGIPDDKWPTDPKDIALLLDRMNRLEPFEMTSAEEIDLRNWRKKVGEYTLEKQSKFKARLLGKVKR